MPARPRRRLAASPIRTPLAVALLLVVAGSVLIVRWRMTALERFAQPAEVLELIEERFVRKPDTQALTRAAIVGMLEELGDPNSVYVPPARAEQFNRSLSGDYVGIGVYIADREGAVEVVTPIAGSPAARAGVRPGDRIVAVAGEPTEGLAADALAERIAGPSGQDVTLTIERDGERLDLTITRGEVRTESVKGLRRLEGDAGWHHALDPERGIAYVRITQFVAGTVEGVRQALATASRQMPQLQGLVLDLRGNPGGIIDQAVGVADLFVGSGDLVRTRDRRGVIQAFAAAPEVAFAGPVVVLIDGASASGAEIVAGALTELVDAAAVGTRTFGKASVQTVYTLPDGGTLKLTEATYTLPSGRDIQRMEGEGRWGVDPSAGMHVPVPEDDAPRLARLYAQLDLVGAGSEDPPLPEEAWDSPQSLLDALGDPQLRAAHTALVGQLENGDWPRVGGDPIAGQDALRLERARRALAQLRQRERELVEEVAQLRAREPADSAPSP